MIVDIEEMHNTVSENIHCSREKKCISSFVDFILLHSPFDDSVHFHNCFRNARNKFKIYPKKSRVLRELQRRTHVSNKQKSALYPFLIKKPRKSTSGVLVVAVLTSPFPEDEHGKKQKFSCKWNCYYCPTEPNQPRSYLREEPAVRRANRNNFCPVKQFVHRLRALENNGHPIDKIELIVLGGTWSSYPVAYQRRFCRDLFYAANTYAEQCENTTNVRSPFHIQKEQQINERASVKIIGLTLETRPDCITEDELRRFRSYGCTRVQIGVQHTDDSVLEKINRGHNVEASVRAIRMLLNHCFKVDIHLMPDLPGSSFRKDRDMFRQILFSKRFGADQIKIYPHSVVPWTRTKLWLDEGVFIPMSSEKLIENIMWFKSKVHPWIRLNRVIRDIPRQYISGGNSVGNLREIILRRMRNAGLRCQCIRCREIRSVSFSETQLLIRTFKANGGKEYFISYETKTLPQKLIGFVRLRIVQQDKNCVFPELNGCALVRELHVYGKLQPTSNHKWTKDNTSIAQHKGFGKRLLQKAEEIAIIQGYKKVAVIAGVGARDYYRNQGYVLRGRGAFMIKYISFWQCLVAFFFQMITRIFNVLKIFWK